MTELFMVAVAVLISAGVSAGIAALVLEKSEARLSGRENPDERKSGEDGEREPEMADILAGINSVLSYQPGGKKDIWR